jgi:hypothetical protein
MNMRLSDEASGGSFRHQLELLGEMLHRTGTATGTACLAPAMRAKAPRITASGA